MERRCDFFHVMLLLFSQWQIASNSAMDPSMRGFGASSHFQVLQPVTWRKFVIRILISVPPLSRDSWILLAPRVATYIGGTFSPGRVLDLNVAELNTAVQKPGYNRLFFLAMLWRMRSDDRSLIG